MSKKFLFLIPFVLVLGLTYTCYGAPGSFMLDFDSPDANGDPNTEAGYTSFLLDTDNGSDVNGITLDILPDTVDLTAPTIVRTKLNAKDQDWRDWGVGVELYPDLVYARYPSGLNITLWELGAGQDCNITLWAYDNQSENRRQSDWYANGVYVFRSDFIGGESWPNCTENPCEYGPPTYAYDFTATADALGRIALTSVIGPNSLGGNPFAFACGLRVIPGTYTSATTYSHRPLPYDGEINVSVRTNLRWRKGTAATRNVYLSTSFSDVDNGVVGARIATATGANTVDPYGATGFLKMEATYYWRVDEIIGGTPQKGEIWSFTTRPYCVVDDWNSYTIDDDLIAVWKDYFTQDPPETDAQCYVEATTVRSGNAMRYWFRNADYDPWYSEVRANMADTAIPPARNGLGMDPNWLGMNTQAVSLFFRGVATNPTTEPMYMILKDNTGKTAQVAYPDINDIKVESWQEWNIALSSFTDANANINLKNISQIIIRFGDGGSAGNNGTVYFDDLTLYPTRCVQLERASDIAVVDYAPGGAPPGDCVVDNQELEVLANTWLYEDVAIETNNPGTTGLVGYWAINEGDSNKIYPTVYDANLGIPEADLVGYMDPCDDVGISSGAISWTTGVPMQFSDGGPWIEGGALHFNGQDGIRVEWGPGGYGAEDLNNFDPSYPNGQLTLAIWAKWEGRHLDKDKCQGLISKRREWAANANGTQFMFECDTYPDPRGAFGLRAYRTSTDTCEDIYAPEHILTGFIGQWAHIAATFDGTTTILYLNGSEVASADTYCFGVGDPCNIGLTIGNVNDGTGWPNGPESFKGTLDEVYIFNRALEPNEVAYLADESPWDGVKTVPIPSAAEIYTKEPSGERVVNFKDFAMVANLWLEEDMYP